MGFRVILTPKCRNEILDEFVLWLLSAFGILPGFDKLLNK